MNAAASPHVSVIMPAYIDLRFLDAAVGSVLAQTYGDYELVIVDDGTGMPDAFARQAGRDRRIRIITNETNLGAWRPRPIAAFARATETSSRASMPMTWPCRSDSPGWFPRLPAMPNSPRRVQLRGHRRSGRVQRHQHMAETDSDIRWTILFHNPFCHSSVAFRRTSFEAAGRLRRKVDTVRGL